MEKFAQQLKKGLLELLILKIVLERPFYGYELITELEQRSNGVFTLKEGTLYPALYRLEDSHFVVAEWQTSEGRKSPKKYYCITDAGIDMLPKLTSYWTELSNSVNSIVN